MVKLPPPPSTMRLTPEYTEYIKSKKWELRRELLLAKMGKWCRGCLKKTGPFQLHHLSYSNLGHETTADVRPLCPKCHREVTALHWKMGKATPGIVVYNTFILQKRKERLNKKRR